MSRNLVKLVCVGFLCLYSSALAQNITDTAKVVKAEIKVEKPAENKERRDKKVVLKPKDNVENQQKPAPQPVQQQKSSNNKKNKKRYPPKRDNNG